jgi:hypothetical protein
VLFLGGTSHENSWLAYRGITQSSQYILYLNSFYFCTTTILTVGYGDITPQNTTEIAIVTMVQIFGKTGSTQASSCSDTS